jgi:hypothetical protein
VTTVLLICGAVVYLTTATVAAYVVRAGLLAREAGDWAPAAALVVGWIIGLQWPILGLAGAILVIARRLKGANR